MSFSITRKTRVSQVMDMVGLCLESGGNLKAARSRVIGAVCGFSHLRDVARYFLCTCCNLLNGPGDFARRGALFGYRISDRGGDFAELADGCSNTLNSFNRFAGGPLDRVDLGGDFFSGLTGLRGQRFYFRGDNGEALASIAGARCFDCRVEGQLEPAAQRFYDKGPPFLQRFLPFWAANLIDRLKVMILPLLTLLYPLFKVLPPAYSWRMRTKVNRWYKDVQKLDDKVRSQEISQADATVELDRIERAVEEVSVPAAFAASAYTLRLHIDFLRRRIDAGGADPGDPIATGGAD